MPGSVFISYARKDGTYVRRLVEHLRSAGIPTWYDSGIPVGDEYSVALQKAIEESAVFIVVMTPTSLDSPWVRREIHHALTISKPIVPLLLAPCEDVLLAGTNRVDVCGGRLPDDAVLDHLRSLTGADAPAPNEPKPRRKVLLAGTGAAVAVAVLITGAGALNRPDEKPPDPPILTPDPSPTRTGGPATAGPIRSVVRFYQNQVGVLVVSGWARNVTDLNSAVELQFTAAPENTGRNTWDEETTADLALPDADGDNGHGFVAATRTESGGIFVVRVRAVLGDRRIELRTERVIVRPAHGFPLVAARQTGETLTVSGTADRRIRAYAGEPGATRGWIEPDGPAAVTVTFSRLPAGRHTALLYWLDPRNDREVFAGTGTFTVR